MLNLLLLLSSFYTNIKDFIHCPPGPLGAKCHKENDHPSSQNDTNDTNDTNVNTNTNTNSNYYNQYNTYNEQDENNFESSNNYQERNNSPNYATKTRLNYLEWIMIGSLLAVVSAGFAFLTFKSVSRFKIYNIITLQLLVCNCWCATAGVSHLPYIVDITLTFLSLLCHYWYTNFMLPI